MENPAANGAKSRYVANYARLGKKEAALDYLEQALEKGYEDFEGMEQDARWAVAPL